MEAAPGSESDVESMSCADLYESLLVRARLLIADLTASQTCLTEQKRGPKQTIRVFRNNVESEMKTLEKCGNFGPQGTTTTTVTGVDDEDAEMKRVHLLRSSNLPFYEAVWKAARRCRGVVALSKRVVWSLGPGSGLGSRQDGVDVCSPARHDRIGGKDSNSVSIDIVADDGAEWIKVSTIAEKRLLFEMAKNGWDGYDDDYSAAGSRSDDEASAEQETSGDGGDRSGGLELLKLARDMTKAASTVRVRYRHPQIHFILPRIRQGSVKEIDGVLTDLRAARVAVECCDESVQPPCLSSSSFQTMLTTNALPRLTSTLNIDCTSLLALISDISHCSPSEPPTLPFTTRAHDPDSPTIATRPSSAFHHCILQLIEREKDAPLLPTQLYPILAARKLVCTAEAAQQMHKIVDTLGTADERSRAEILLGVGAYRGLRPDALRQALNRCSTYHVPNDLRLPIEEVAYDAKAVLLRAMSPARKLPVDMATDVDEQMRLSEINKSVFLYVWDTGFVTVTSNRAVALGIEKAVNRVLDGYEKGDCKAGDRESSEKQLVGPDIWICATARSLIGKVNGRKEERISSKCF